MRQVQPMQRRLRAAFVGALAVRLAQAAQRTRRLQAASALFRRSVLSRVRGFGWIPRAWHLRRGILFRWLRGQTLRVHRGRRWRRLFVQRWVVGYAAGVYARTTTVAVFKKKASAKKRRRRQQQPTGAAFDWRIQRIKDVKAGVRRPTALQHDAGLEAQLRTFT